jgi:hypothetical protein
LHAGANRNEADILLAGLGSGVERSLRRRDALCFAVCFVLLLERRLVLLCRWLVEALGTVRVESFCASFREPFFARLVVSRFALCCTR